MSRMEISMKHSNMSKFFNKLPFYLVAAIALSGCNSNEKTEEIQPYFDRSSTVQLLKDQASNCDLNWMSPNHVASTWLSKKSSESSKYSWIEYSSYSDYYQFRLQDSSYEKYDTEDVEKTNKCINFLSTQIGELGKLTDPEAVALKDQYQQLLENRKQYLDAAVQLDALVINRANRANYLSIENQKRELSDSKDVILYKIRELIDYEYRGNVRVFIERCPDAFSVMGNDTVIDGSMLLTNTSGDQQQIDLTVRYKDSNDVLVGDSLVYETVPGNSKVRVTLSGAGSSGAVTGGAVFPARCTIS